MAARTVTAIALLVIAAVAILWFRSERSARPSPLAAAQTAQFPDQSPLHPGGDSLPQPPPPPEYQETAYAVSDGGQLYRSFNCDGCHQNGGGGIGPALMDDRWIYGSEPGNIFQTIVQGRPNGMPSFRGKIPEQQVWHLVAYVRSLSGLVPSAARPARDDHMQTQPPSSLQDTQQPVNGGLVPPAAERRQ